ncbi:histidine kinase [Phyllobacterium zundukense]|uniref:Oxygen sensor histidine kinase NreB n=1 Tax=Phyllobacterium zundukense TaxID=1867719 RepID=A0A2N9VYY6_9HYPH|nr:histidine kinase [Phyllobacterium zundukense]PIO44704.1 histidine kinase [Phyllobacterium zundukense]
MENVETPVRELRRLYRESEAKAARLRLIVETRGILDANDFDFAARQVLAHVCSFCGASFARIEFSGDQSAQTISYERNQTSFGIVFIINLDGDDPTVSLTVTSEAQALLGSDDRQSLIIVADQVLSALSERRRRQERETFTGALRGREAMLAHLVAEMIDAQEKERARVAYDLHDGVAQSLISLLHHLQAAAAGKDDNTQITEKLENYIDLTRRCVREIRHAIADLRPAELDELGLAAAIRAKLDSTPVGKVSFTNRLSETRLPRPVEIVLYRVAQEALVNAEKHAACTHIQIDLAEDTEGRITLIISDNGRGFIPDEHSPERGYGFGLSAIRERLALIGGTLSIDSSPGAGTRLVADVPVGLNLVRRS